MADAAHDEHEHGSMDITAQRATYGRILGLIKWAIVLIALALVMLAFTRTNAVDCKKTDLAKAHLNDCGKLHAGQAEK